MKIGIMLYTELIAHIYLRQEQNSEDVNYQIKWII